MILLSTALSAPNLQAQVEQTGINPLIAIGAFLLMLFILVVVHELGHFLSAVWLGIRVEEFGIGYPPRMTTLFVHKGVKYTFNWLPLGGFVRFATDENGNDDPLYGAGGSLAAAQPWRKIIVMVAGPLMNLVLAIAIFAVIFAFNGVPVPTGAAVIGEVYPNTPAAAAGFQAGDVLISLEGTRLSPDSQVSDIARARLNQATVAVVVRGEQEITLNVTPGPWTSPDGEARNGFGFAYTNDIEVQPVGLLGAIGAGSTYTWNLLGQMFNGLASIPASIMSLFSPNNSGEGPIGPVGIARATGEVLQQEQGLLAFWNLTAVLSLNLFLLNLLPIPALDGSHIIFALIEWARGGKKLPPEREAMVHAIGFMALMGLMLLITVNDVMKAFSGTPVLGGN